MPADFWAVVEFLGFVVAASLLVFGAWKLDMRLLAAGAALAGVAWLGIAFTTSDEWTTPELVTLRLLPIDALRREVVAGAVVDATEMSDTGSSATCRLPVRPEEPSGRNGPVLAVSLVVERQIEGSLVEQHNDPLAHTRVVDQTLEITAPGYRPWRGTLAELLPGGRPTEVESPIAIVMEPK